MEPSVLSSHPPHQHPSLSRLPQLESLPKSLLLPQQPLNIFSLQCMRFFRLKTSFWPAPPPQWFLRCHPPPPTSVHPAPDLAKAFSPPQTLCLLQTDLTMCGFRPCHLSHLQAFDHALSFCRNKTSLPNLHGVLLLPAPTSSTKPARDSCWCPDHAGG